MGEKGIIPFDTGRFVREIMSLAAARVAQRMRRPDASGWSGVVGGREQAIGKDLAARVAQW